MTSSLQLTACKERGTSALPPKGKEFHQHPTDARHVLAEPPVEHVAVPWRDPLHGDQLTRTCQLLMHRNRRSVRSEAPGFAVTGFGAQTTSSGRAGWVRM